MNKRMSKFLFFPIIILFGITSRVLLGVKISKGGTVLDLFALIALLSLTSGYTNFKKYIYLIPITIMSISDLFLYLIGIDAGLSSINLLLITSFVWSGFGIITFLGKFVSKKTKKSSFTLFATAGVCGSLIYDVWTNFGFWLGPFYTHNIHGLILCYTMAIPFILEHLITTIALTPIFYIVAKWGKELFSKSDNLQVSPIKVSNKYAEVQIENF